MGKTLEVCFFDIFSHSESKSKVRLLKFWLIEPLTNLLSLFVHDCRLYQSRIDRIYIKENLLPFSWNWGIKRTGLNTDHLILNPKLPHLGDGRYVVPISLINDMELMEILEKVGMKYKLD